MEPWTEKQCEADEVRQAAKRLQTAEKNGMPVHVVRRLATVAIRLRNAFKAKYGHNWNEVNK